MLTRERLRAGGRQGIALLPSVFTAGNLSCGFLALVLAAAHRHVEAALCIFAAILMDMVDGRVARLVGATSRFGARLDSLADAVSFSVAPAFLVHVFALSRLGGWAGLGPFVFALCGVVRLARFNVTVGGGDHEFFVGLPAPAAGGLLASMTVLLAGHQTEGPALLTVASAMALAALLMVSGVRYRTVDLLGFARRRPIEAALVVAAAVLLAATFREAALVGLFSLYALAGPAHASWIRLRRLWGGVVAV